MTNENYVSLKEEKFKILQNIPLGSDAKDSEQDGIKNLHPASPNLKEKHDKPRLTIKTNTKEPYYQRFNKKSPHK